MLKGKRRLKARPVSLVDKLREKEKLDIYAAYPKKVGKGQALKAIGQLS